MKKDKKMNYANGPSLDQVNSSIEIPKNAGFWKTLLAYSGPGALVAVGYIDPGNWITSIDGGAKYQYTLLSVILISSLMAMLLQHMSLKLGIVTQMDLAQATEKYTKRGMKFFLWICTELAVMATDIAEIIGGAIALELLFNIPLLWGTIITIFDVFLLLLLMKLGFRKIEAIVVALIFIIFGVFAYEVFLAKPNISQLFQGFTPTAQIARDKSMLFLSLGIVGATVMPHNLYLHSSLAQTRKVNYDDQNDIAKAIKFSTWDSNIQLFAAFIINSLLLVLGAALFYGKNSDLGTFRQLFDALQNPSIVGSIASPMLATLFAVALLASGQNSTITGTLTGQIVMEGFIHIRLKPWARRFITRLISVIPVIICIIIYGDSELAVEDLLLYSQVFLSIALPISIIPLTLFTTNRQLMGERFVVKGWVKYTAIFSTVLLTVLNVWLIYATITNQV